MVRFELWGHHRRRTETLVSSSTGQSEGRQSRNLLRSHLVRSLVLVVDAAEVGHDDRDGQGYHQDSTEGADGAEDLPSDGVGDHVSIPAGWRCRVSLQNNPFKVAAPQPSAILRASQDILALM